MISTIIDVYFCILVFLIGFFIAWIYSRNNLSIRLSVTAGLWIYHLLFIIVYLNYLPGDWLNYYDVSSQYKGSWIDLFGMGTQSIYFLTYPFSNTLDLSVISCFFIFSLFGYIGILNWYKIYSKYAGNKLLFNRINVFPAILFFPNIHIWTVAIGKDSIIFYAISIVVLALLEIRKRWLSLILSLILITYIRIHITLIIIISLVFALIFFNRQISFLSKTLLSSILISFFYFLFPFLLNFVGIPDFSIEIGFSYLENLQGFRSDASTYVDFRSLSPPLKIFSYLFRPLFIDAPNAGLAIFSLENFVWLLLAIVLVHKKFLAWFRSENLAVQFSLIYVLLGAYILSHGLSNFGLIMRQKMMLIPCLGLMSISFLSFLKNSRI